MTPHHVRTNCGSVLAKAQRTEPGNGMIVFVPVQSRSGDGAFWNHYFLCIPTVFGEGGKRYYSNPVQMQRLGRDRCCFDWR